MFDLRRVADDNVDRARGIVLRANHSRHTQAQGNCYAMGNVLLKNHILTDPLMRDGCVGAILSAGGPRPQFRFDNRQQSPPTFGQCYFARRRPTRAAMHLQPVRLARLLSSGQHDIIALTALRRRNNDLQYPHKENLK